MRIENFNDTGFWFSAFVSIYALKY